jgi:hypothetical protein
MRPFLFTSGVLVQYGPLDYIYVFGSGLGVTVPMLLKKRVAQIKSTFTKTKRHRL